MLGNTEERTNGCARLTGAERSRGGAAGWSGVTWGDADLVWTVPPERCSWGMDLMEGYALRRGGERLQAICSFFLTIQEVGLAYMKWNYPAAVLKPANGGFSHVAPGAWRSRPRSVAGSRCEVRFDSFTEKQFSCDLTRQKDNLWLAQS